jgi:hypothetical protein
MKEFNQQRIQHREKRTGVVWLRFDQFERRFWIKATIDVLPLCFFSVSE